MLETEIKNLTAQIEKLNNNFEALFNSANAEPAKTEKVKESKPEKVKEEKGGALTAQDIKDLCLVKARASAGNKAKIKAILSEKGANLVDDLKESDYEEVRNKIGAL